MMSRKLPVSLLLLTCGLAALPACGGDDGGGSGDATATGTDPDTSAGTQGVTSSVTMDDSASLTGADTTVDPSETTDPTEDTVDPDTSTGEPAGGAAFRFNSVAIRDPHFFYELIPGLPSDITDTVNSSLTEALTTDDPKMPDGNYDLDFVLTFDPLDQSDGGAGDFVFANGDCSVAEPTTCTLQVGTELFPSTYSSLAAGTCQEADPTNLSAEYTPAPGATTGPCFVSGAASVTIATSNFSLPLADATVAAQYVGDPAANLVSGTVIGFVTLAAAQAAVVDGTGLPVDGSPVSDLLEDSAMDEGGTGWWLHMDFTAVAATWNG